MKFTFEITDWTSLNMSSLQTRLCSPSSAGQSTGRALLLSVCFPGNSAPHQSRVCVSGMSFPRAIGMQEACYRV